MHRQNYEINICFVQQPLQSAVYTFKKKIKEQKKADLEAKERFRYGLHYGLHLSNCTFTVSVVEPKRVSYIDDDLANCVFLPTGKSNNAVCRTV